MPPKKRKATGPASTPESTKRITRFSTKPSAPVERSPAKPSKVESKSEKAAITFVKASCRTKDKKTAPASIVNPKPGKSKATVKAKGDQSEDATSTPNNVESLSISSELVKSPIHYNYYAPSASSSNSSPSLIFTHGAGGTLSAPAVVNFCTGFSTALPVLVFQGFMNLGSRVKGFHACIEYTTEKSRKKDEKLVLGGRSMGARAAVIATSEFLETEDDERTISLILVSYPLRGPKDVRDQILLDLSASVNILFIIGDRDAMCPLDLLEDVRPKMKAKSQLVVVRGADHGMHTKPAKLEKEIGEQTGRTAVDWVAGNVQDEVVYVGEEG